MSDDNKVSVLPTLKAEYSAFGVSEKIRDFALKNPEGHLIAYCITYTEQGMVVVPLSTAISLPEISVVANAANLHANNALAASVMNRADTPTPDEPPPDSA